MRTQDTDQMPGNLTMLVCPECGGSLWEIADGKMLRYRCHTGHAFTQKNLLEEQAERIEGSLWSAVRILEERVKLYQTLAAEAEAKQRLKAASQYRAREGEMLEKAATIRTLIMRR